MRCASDRCCERAIVLFHLCYRHTILFHFILPTYDTFPFYPTDIRSVLGQKGYCTLPFYATDISVSPEGLLYIFILCHRHGNYQVITSCAEPSTTNHTQAHSDDYLMITDTYCNVQVISSPVEYQRRLQYVFYGTRKSNLVRLFLVTTISTSHFA